MYDSPITGGATALFGRQRVEGVGGALRDPLTDVGAGDRYRQAELGPSQARRAEEHRKAFRRTVKWRTGSEGRISYLKRGYGWDRTRIDGIEGARIWTGHGVHTHNLVKISALAG
jgi:transposase, IS5 family